jgi:hypothetical protein
MLTVVRSPGPTTAATQVTRERFDVTVRRRTLVWATALVVAAAAVIGAFALGRGDPQPDPPAPGDTPAQDYRNLADWLREQAKD